MTRKALAESRSKIIKTLPTAATVEDAIIATVDSPLSNAELRKLLKKLSTERTGDDAVSFAYVALAANLPEEALLMAQRVLSEERSFSKLLLAAECYEMAGHHGTAKELLEEAKTAANDDAAKQKFAEAEARFSAQPFQDSPVVTRIRMQASDLMKRLEETSSLKDVKAVSTSDLRVFVRELNRLSVSVGAKCASSAGGATRAFVTFDVDTDGLITSVTSYLPQVTAPQLGACLQRELTATKLPAVKLPNKTQTLSVMLPAARP